MRHLRSSLLVLSVIGGVAGHAGAQPQKTFTKGAFTAAPVAPPITQSIVNVQTDSVSGTTNTATNGALDGVPILNGFHFRFSNGDHEFRKISVLAASTNSATIAFIDKNSDDPYKAEATWINVKGGGTRGEVHAAGMSHFDIPLPTQRPPNTRLVLTGFELRDKDDQDVRMMGVWLDEARNVARVSLVDWVGQWVEGVGSRLGTAEGPLNDINISKKVFPNAAAADAWVRDNQRASQRIFAAHVQYAFIPTSIVAGEDYFTGTGRAPASGKQFQSRAGVQGFEFYFDQKAHHIREVGLMPPLAGAATRLRVPANEFIEFQDTNRDDPIKWAVKLLTIKP